MALRPLILRFEVEDFENKIVDLDSDESDGFIYSETVTDSRDNPWILSLTLNDTSECDSESGEIMVYIYLENLGDENFSAEMCLVLRDSHGKRYKERRFTPNGASEPLKYNPCLFKAQGGNSGGEFIKLSEIVNKHQNILSDGAVLIDAELQVKPERKALFIPANPLLKGITKLLESGEHADVSFRVGGEVVRAHRLILSVNAPTLAAFCDGFPPEKAIPIADVSLETFRAVLSYVYGGNIPDAAAILNTGKEIIVAADRFGVLAMKLAVEAGLVQNVSFDFRVASDMLTFADDNNCQFLKQFSIAYIVAHSSDFFRSKYWRKLKQSPKLMEEIMLEMSGSATNGRRNGRH